MFLSLICCTVFCCSVFCRRFVSMGSCVVELLQRVIVSSMINFFASFHIGNSDDKVRFNRVIKSNFVRQYAPDMKF